MDNLPFISYEIAERSFVSYVKREIHHGAVLEGYPEARVGNIDIAVSELTSNLIKHAGKGELLYRFSNEMHERVFEMISLDNGPGLKDVAHSMKDGVSTTKTLGQGLGALQRLSNAFFMYSIPKWGTICYSRIYASPVVAPEDSNGMKFRTLNISKPGQKMSGDGFHVVHNASHTKIFMGDGLGHGQEAFTAVQLAISNFKKCEESDPSGIIRFIHEPVKKTRGLVATVAVADHQLKKWRICGIGNISTRLYQGLTSKSYISYNGIIGLQLPVTLKNHVSELDQHQCLIMCSDGIRTRWDLAQYPSILRHDPIMLAAVIYKEHSRKTDDMSILIART